MTQTRETRSDQVCPTHHVRKWDVHRGPVHWSYCGLCEGAAARLFIAGVRSPELQRRLERAARAGP